MAYYRIDYFSPALRRQASFEMLIPNDFDVYQSRPVNMYTLRPMKTLFLLHGYTGKAGNWVPDYLPDKYNFAIVMPSAENSFYLNGEATGSAYETLVAEELPRYIRKTFGLATRPQDTYIAGLSMGGFGALHTGLAHPEVFGKIGALSSALIVHEVAKMEPGEGNDVANYAYYAQVFGDPATAAERDCNPERLVKKLQAAGKKLPEIYMCCGTEDFLLENNRAFHKFLTDAGVVHEYHEGPGRHDMAFWSEHIVKIADWMFA